MMTDLDILRITDPLLSLAAESNWLRRNGSVAELCSVASAGELAVIDALLDRLATRRLLASRYPARTITRDYEVSK